MYTIDFFVRNKLTLSYLYLKRIINNLICSEANRSFGNSYKLIYRQSLTLLIAAICYSTLYYIQHL